MKISKIILIIFLASFSFASSSLFAKKYIKPVAESVPNLSHFGGDYMVRTLPDGRTVYTIMGDSPSDDVTLPAGAESYLNDGTFMTHGDRDIRGSAFAR
jgi:hypothetical protein